LYQRREVGSTKHTIYSPYNLSKSSPCFAPIAFSISSSSKASGEPLPKYKNSGCGEIVPCVYLNLIILRYDSSIYIFSVRRDRKSTRLNSIHVKISYAV